jgi:hypothetical protein
MSTSTTLIQPQEVVNDGILNGGPISDRFDAALLSAHVKPAEIRFLRPLLCEAFYLDLIKEKTNLISNYNALICPVVEAYGPTKPVYEKLWQEYILPFLSYAVLYQSAPFIGTQIGSNGIFAMNTQFSETQGIAGAKYIQDTLLNTIEILKEELRRHLCENVALYPLFCNDCHCNCDCGAEDCKECKRTKPHTPKLGIVFYGKRNKNNNNNKNNLW